MQVGTAKALIVDLLRTHGREASLTPVFLNVGGEWLNLASTVEDLFDALADIEDDADFVLDMPDETGNVIGIRIDEGSLLVTVEPPKTSG
jgi:hypothetical protein